MNNEYTLIWIEKKERSSDKKNKYRIINPKGLIGMNLDKGLGSLKWSKRTIKNCKCFIYDPGKLSLFKEDGSQNIEIIEIIMNKEKKENKN